MMLNGRENKKGGDSVGKAKCKVHTGERGGHYVMVRKKDGGTRRDYVS
jgi:hypothetical protein